MKTRRFFLSLNLNKRIKNLLQASEANEVPISIHV